MALTLQGRSHLSPDSFPTAQLFLLAICRVAEPIALTSIFPYSWVMVKDFHMDNGNNASFYAGILISAFSLAEALTCMFWGALLDRLGRKPILLSGCVGTMASLIMVGMAPNFWVALAGRALGGALNGNIGIIQTMVGELVKRPEHEPRAYSIMPFVWSIGTIIGPAIGGLLAKPAEGFPSVFLADGLFGKFPYLLPNLVCCVLLLLNIAGSWLFLQETHPNMQSGEVHGHFDEAAEQPLLVTSGATANAGVDLRAESYGTFNRVHLHNDENWNVRADGSLPTWKKLPKPKAFTWRVIMLVIALAIFTYHSMTYDHLLPIFLQDKDSRGLPHLHHSPFDIPGGVGLSTRAVGVIMSFDGIIALMIQSIISPMLAHYLGIWRLFIIVTVLHPIAYFMVPFLVFLPAQLIYFGIYACLIVRNILSIIGYPILLVLIKQASPSDSVMGKINGLAASAGAASRTLAPPIAGFLYSCGAEIGCIGVAWWGSSLVALVGALQLGYIQRDKRSSATVEPAAVCHYVALPDQPHDEIVHIIINGDDVHTEAVIESD
ncbi:Tetracycline resistance protein TetA/multidrug resistance protein MdtG [Penicillium cf. griseofulvum]|uniref:Tetracycline resistance protein TetA/multidrug resistance protein MdtG n=1 Tax=Penicillium cf. griseofulvum TaxID=2972120 RepID=A0A9W9JTI7_9EURO|nr:Tetracycline resistance protein TetA/multidrug resistance protein MdtG [Penicillium cf. griseofulvum]